MEETEETKEEFETRISAYLDGELSAEETLIIESACVTNKEGARSLLSDYSRIGEAMEDWAEETLNCMCSGKEFFQKITDELDFSLEKSRERITCFEWLKDKFFTPALVPIALVISVGIIYVSNFSSNDNKRVLVNEQLQYRALKENEAVEIASALSNTRIDWVRSVRPWSILQSKTKKGAPVIHVALGTEKLSN